MESHHLQLLPQLDVVIDYTAGIPNDVLSAAEIMVILLAPAFAQQNIHTKRALIEVYETNVKVSLYKADDAPVKEYVFAIDSLLDEVNHARQRTIKDENVDFKLWVLSELDKVYQEQNLW